MGLTVISATPSPYARKVRIALLEKDIPFTLQTEVPWDNTTKTPEYNPLEKLPVLIPDDQDKSSAVYESHFILDWIETKYPPPRHTRIYPEDADQRLLAKRIEVIADGICDAWVLLFFEKQRDHPSQEWMDRQMRKVTGGLRALSEFVGADGSKEFLVGGQFSLADVAAGAVLGYLKVRAVQVKWAEEYPALKAYHDRLEERKSFRETVPAPQNIKDKIV